MQTPPTRPIAIGALLVFALFAVSAALTARSYIDLHSLVANELDLRQLAGRLLYQREQLSSAARLAVETGDAAWEQRYRAVVPQFEASLREAVALAPPQSVSASPTWSASAALADLEERAFELLHQDQGAEARGILSGADYLDRQQSYIAGLEALGDEMLAQAQGRLRLQRQWVLIMGLSGLSLLAMLAAAWTWISGLTQQYLAAVRRSEWALSESNRTLETRVQARTAELHALNQQLRTEMEHRSKVELELRQSQKLEAIGRLAAGVAHEINTPIQFVSDSCHYMRDGEATVLELLERYRQAIRDLADGAADAGAVARDLERVWQQAHADALEKHLPEAGQRAIEGLDRIAQIVRSMKAFSHRGGGRRVPTDLNRAIDNTLTIARSEYKDVADVHTDYGELPLVPCFPGELNQVLLNLVVNAAQAIAESVHGSERRGRIDIRTCIDGDAALIQVADDGPGIADEIRDRIFEPFFTTKEVGKGSGQGLAIAHAVIVEQHRGTLSVDSAAGRGARFTIRLPLHPADSGAPNVEGLWHG